MRKHPKRRRLLAVVFSLVFAVYLLPVSNGYGGGGDDWLVPDTLLPGGTNPGQVELAADRFEPNNSTAQATAISPSTVINDVSIHNFDDIDFYKFTLSAKASIVAEVNNFIDGCTIKFTLLNENGIVIKQSSRQLGLVERVETTLEAGTYYLSVSMWGSLQTTKYQLSLTTSVANVTVTWDAQGGTVTPQQSTYYPGGSYLYLPIPYRAGYEFSGWFPGKNGVGRAVSKSDSLPTVDTTFYAYWVNERIDRYEPNETYDRASSISVPTVISDANIHVATDRDNYQFTLTTKANIDAQLTGIPSGCNFDLYLLGSNGIVTRQSSSQGTTAERITVDLEPGKYILMVLSASGASKDYYTLQVAVKEILTPAKKITVTWNADRGVCSPTAQEVEAGKELGALPVATRSGYEFGGWYTARSGAGTQISSATKAPGTSVTYYAKWTQVRTVTIIWMASGGVVNPLTEEKVSGQPFGTLPTPTRTGYVFDGWYTALNGGGTLISGSSIVSSTTLCYYAKWIRNVIVSIKLDADGGAVSPGTLSLTAGNTFGTLPMATKSGQVFSGWYTARNGVGTSITASSIVPETGTTLYANWSAAARIVTVTLNADGGTVQPASLSLTAGDTYGGLPIPIRSGKTFAGWYSARNGAGTSIIASSIVPQTGTTIYAYWKDISARGSVTVLLDADGGTVSPASLSLTAGEVYGVLPVPLTSGKTFMGWYTAKNGLGTSVVASSIVPAQGGTLYAYWKDGGTNAILVTLDADGGTGAPASLLLTPGVAFGALPVPAKTGKVFGGWYTAKNAAGTSITAASIVPQLGCTLYAYWKDAPSRVTVTFDADGGTVSPATMSGAPGQNMSALPIPKREGFPFGGWYTEKNGGGVKLGDKPSVFPQLDATYYANWTVKITYNPMQGKVDPLQENKLPNTPMGKLPVPTRSGYRFTGWYPSEDAKSEEAITEKTTVPTQSAIYYAAWEKTNFVTVTWSAEGGSPEKKSEQKTPRSVFGKLPQPTRDGYRFDGWLSQGARGLLLRESSVVPDVDTIYYASWKKVETDIWEPNDSISSATTRGTNDWTATGTISSINDKDFFRMIVPTEELVVILLRNIPARCQYNLTLRDGNGDVVARSEKTDNTRQISETLKPGTYFVEVSSSGGYSETEGYRLSVGVGQQKITVTWDSDGGDTTPTPTQAVASAVFTELPQVSREGFLFKGWYTEKNGRGMPIAKGDPVPERDVNYFARWVPAEVVITFDADGGVLSFPVMQKTPETDFGVLPVPSKAGYPFGGWFTEKNGAGMFISEESPVPTENTIYYAKWSDAPLVTLTWNTGDGRTDMPEEMRTVGTIYQSLPLPKRASEAEKQQMFLGWYTAPAGQGERLGDGFVVPTMDTIYFANWVSVSQLSWNFVNEDKLLIWTGDGIAGQAFQMAANVFNDYRPNVIQRAESAQAAEVFVGDMYEVGGPVGAVSPSGVLWLNGAYMEGKEEPAILSAAMHMLGHVLGLDHNIGETCMAKVPASVTALDAVDKYNYDMAYDLYYEF